jgi:tetratricopeptide (TPR) repeat protein
MNQQWPSLADLPDDAEAPDARVSNFDAETATAGDLVLFGLQIARSGDLHQAAEIFANAILKDAEMAEAYEALSTVLVPLGQVEFAAHAKAKAIVLGYNSASSWEMLGDMLQSLGKFPDAAEAFKSALELGENPSSRMKLEAVLDRGSDARTDRHLDSAAAATGLEFLSVASIPPAWRRVSIVTISPEGNPHTAAFDDLVTAFESGLNSLGIDVERRKNIFDPRGVNLLFGAHLIGSQGMAQRVPPNSVIVNLEQIKGFDVAAQPVYLGLLRRLPVWDYSHRNIEALRDLTHSSLIRHVGIGYVQSMTRSVGASEQATDVLFYGSVNPRRAAVLQALTNAGLKVEHLFSVYGEDRDRAIARAKVVLNVHFHEDSIHEIVRTSYLLANRKAVVTECGPATEIEDDIRQAMLAVPYAGLVASCIMLVRDSARRHQLEEQGFQIFSKRSQSQMLRRAIAATAIPGVC